MSCDSLSILLFLRDRLQQMQRDLTTGDCCDSLSILLFLRDRLQLGSLHRRNSKCFMILVEIKNQYNILLAFNFNC